MVLTTNELRDIALLLSERLKVDYTHFADGFLRRRMTRLFEKMAFHRIQDLNNAMASLVKFDEIAYFLSIPQTELFRIPSFWRRLVKILADKDIKNIWIPDLGSYHELYSLLIILDIAGRRNDVTVTVNVVSDRITNAVKNLILNKKEDPQDLSNFQRLELQASYADYVTPDADSVPHFRPDLLDGVKFRNGWFLNYDDQSFDIIILRDVLLAYDRDLHKKAVAHLANSLSRPGATLCLGAMERPLGSEDRFDASAASDGVYTLIK